GPNSVFKSTDGAANWNATDLPGVWGVFAFAIDPLTPTTLYAGAMTIGGAAVYKSTNSGVNWNPTGLITWPYVSSVSLNPTSVIGGRASTGTVTLTAAAPTGGATVTLGTDTNVATVPTSMTVAAGSLRAAFT